MDAQLKKGFLEVFVLAALRTEESYGYKIISDISPYMEISESTLYPILKRLEAGGYLVTRTKAYNGRLRKYYRITTAGVAKIRSFMQDISELNRLSEFIRRGDR
ncbi:MAG: PadR family transcriptional regulator [Corallococcus sp.]|nr:PadR family transcriptional regulator [Corallococcus sp.]MCM1359190.1 PadR family transcriptional regulator [Corallococcus sp.]MCM1394580.1 PadR family transcriptional regulator [Corallococcus sp.]